MGNGGILIGCGTKPTPPHAPGRKDPTPAPSDYRQRVPMDASAVEVERVPFMSVPILLKYQYQYHITKQGFVRIELGDLRGNDSKWARLWRSERGELADQGGYLYLPPSVSAFREKFL